jgi:hypothetical protein
MSATLLAFINEYIGPSSRQGKTPERRAPDTFRHFRDEF